MGVDGEGREGGGDGIYGMLSDDYRKNETKTELALEIYSDRKKSGFNILAVVLSCVTAGLNEYIKRT